jgi:hypothetical protein
MATAVAVPTPSPKQPWRDAAMRAWRSKRVFALVMLGIAVILGAYLRFYHLTLADMNADEGASWAAATAPNLHLVAATEQRIELLGKLPLYDFVLHGWVRVFGGSLFTMRALSAGMGTVAIGLLFVAVREVCLWFADEPDVEVAELAGAFAALLFATNVRMVLESRLVRMFPLMLAAEFLQILFFVRAQRKGGLSNYAGIAAFSALMIALEFSSSLLLVAEGLWLGVLLLGKLASARAGRLAIFRPGFAVLAGLGLLVPVLLAGVAASSARAVRFGDLDWIRLQPITWPYEVLRHSVGSHKLFWILAALGVLGAWRQWRRARLASAFFSIWMAGPLLAVLAVTYLIHSLEFYRYVLIAFAGLFALAALGAASFRSTIVRVAVAALLVSLSIRPTHHAINHPHQASWREAVALAAKQAAPGERIAVYPDYCENVVRFYVEPARRGEVYGVDDCRKPASLLLLTGWGIMPHAQIAAMEKCYPHLIKRLFLVEVRSR